MGNLADYFRVSSQGRIRLGLGEVVDSKSEIATWRAREAFLLALQETALPALQDMAANTRFIELWMEYLELEISLEPQYSANGKLTGEIPDAVKQAAFALLDEVATWARKWNLEDPWITALVLDATIDPSTLPQRIDLDTGELRVRLGLTDNRVMQVIAPLLRAPGPRMLFAGKDYGSTDYWPMSVFPTDPENGDDDAVFDWNPAVESRTDNLGRAVEAFTARYRAAQDARLKEAQERYPHTTQTRSYEHFTWLVQYQVLKMTYAEIARQAFKSRQTVADAIQNAAKLIDLKLREPDPPGRKPIPLTGIDRSQQT